MPKIDFKKGFTLIELMVVISIIAILAAAGMIVYESTQATGRDGKRIADLEQVSNALETYFTNNGGYPEVATCNTADQTCPTDFSSSSTYLNSANFGTSLSSYFAGSNIPSDPNGSGYYQYFVCSGATQASAYIVCATLESCGSKCNYNSSNGPPNACDPNLAFTPASGNNMICRTVKK